MASDIVEQDNLLVTDFDLELIDGDGEPLETDWRRRAMNLLGQEPAFSRR